MNASSAPALESDLTEIDVATIYTIAIRAITTIGTQNIRPNGIRICPKCIMNTSRPVNNPTDTGVAIASASISGGNKLTAKILTISFLR